MLFPAKRPLISLFSKCHFLPVRWLRNGAGTSPGPVKPNGAIVNTSSSNRRYTPEEDEKILRGYNEGQTSFDLAADLSRSGQGVRTRYLNHLSAHPSSKNGALWSTVDDNSLLDARRRGDSLKTISFKLSRTPEAVRDRFRRLLPKDARRKCDPRKFFSPSEDLAILRLRDNEHRSFRHIGRLIERDRTSVGKRYHYLTDLDLISGHHPSLHGVKYTAQEDAKLIRMKETEGSSYGEIARRLDRTIQSVQQRYYGYLRNKHYIRQQGRCVLWTDVEDRRFIELRIAGYDWVQIAAELSPRSRYAVKARHALLMDKQSRIARPITDPSSLIWRCECRNVWLEFSDRSSMVATGKLILIRLVDPSVPLVKSKMEAGESLHLETSAKAKGFQG